LRSAEHAGARRNPSTPQEFLAGHPLALDVFARLTSLLGGPPEVEIRVSKSQIAFRRRRGFAYLWLPRRYLSHPNAEVVLSIALGRHDPSPRFKEVTHPSPKHWMHHLEVRDPSEIDESVAAWLREAAERAG
jgi:hypothetical protein